MTIMHKNCVDRIKVLLQRNNKTGILQTFTNTYLNITSPPLEDSYIMSFLHFSNVGMHTLEVIQTQTTESI
jgi:hypothetical protein